MTTNRLRIENSMIFSIMDIAVLQMWMCRGSRSRPISRRKGDSPIFCGEKAGSVGHVRHAAKNRDSPLSTGPERCAARNLRRIALQKRADQMTNRQRMLNRAVRLSRETPIADRHRRRWLPASEPRWLRGRQTKASKAIWNYPSANCRAREQATGLIPWPHTDMRRRTRPACLCSSNSNTTPWRHNSFRVLRKSPQHHGSRSVGIAMRPCSADISRQAPHSLG